MNYQHICGIGVATCTPIPFVEGPNGKPVPAKVSIHWHHARMALSTPTNYNSIELFEAGKEVGDARNSAARRCLEHDPRPRYLFFLDYDVLPSPDALRKLIYRAETNPDVDIVAGVYCSKSSLPEPLIYTTDGVGPYWDWTVGDLLFNITRVHMGLTLIRTSLFERIEHTEANPWFYTPSDCRVLAGGVQTRRGTEDIWFCRRAEAVGARILVDTSVLAGHLDPSTDVIYGLPADSVPVRRARWLRQGQTGEPRPDLLEALDLGAGPVRREWPGYRTSTTDLRSDVGADYVQDTLALNLLDESFDLVASSHHLEHLPRWEQPRAWSEIFRVCRPGGRIEHVVPSIEWAAATLVEIESGRHPVGDYGHVMNVLYGAQESHGYARELNTHYFGYSKSIARSLAEDAGFTDVVVRDWRDEPHLNYNLVITGRKPAAEEQTDDSSDQSPEACVANEVAA